MTVTSKLFADILVGLQALDVDQITNVMDAVKEVTDGILLGWNENNRSVGSWEIVFRTENAEKIGDFMSVVQTGLNRFIEECPEIVHIRKNKHPEGTESVLTCLQKDLENIDANGDVHCMLQNKPQKLELDRTMIKYVEILVSWYHRLDWQAENCRFVLNKMLKVT